MNTQPLADIVNPKTRLAEFERRVRRGSAVQLRQTILEAMADQYPPLRHQAALEASALLDCRPPDGDFEQILRELAHGEPRRAIECTEATALEPTTIPSPLAAVREAACLALRSSTSSSTVEALLEAAEDDVADVRYQALVSLHNVAADGQPFDRLVERRLDDDDPEVVVVAAQIAAHRHRTDLVDTISRRWRQFSGTNALQLAFSLAELAGEHGADANSEVTAAVVDQLIDALGDEPTIAAASQALATLDSQRAVDALKNVVGRWFAHPILKVEAAGALHQLGDPAGAAYLEKSLSSRRKDARGYALRLVGRLRIDGYFDQLQRLAQADDYHADTAVLALADYGGDQARAVIEDVVAHHPQPAVRKLAADQL